MKKRGLIKCPSCKREGDWFSSPYGPFCSRRCKLIDLGKWFDEDHVISEPIPAEQRDSTDAHENTNFHE
jgi:endogenous inhibitor of DNA gyrase (YacG/DUF329 family)